MYWSYFEFQRVWQQKYIIYIIYIYIYLFFYKIWIKQAKPSVKMLFPLRSFIGVSSWRCWNDLVMSLKDSMRISCFVCYYCPFHYLSVFCTCDDIRALNSPWIRAICTSAIQNTQMRSDVSSARNDTFHLFPWPFFVCSDPELHCVCLMKVFLQWILNSTQLLFIWLLLQQIRLEVCPMVFSLKKLEVIHHIH